jgi:hypothetical protein
MKKSVMRYTFGNLFKSLLFSLFFSFNIALCLFQTVLAVMKHSNSIYYIYQTLFCLLIDELVDIFEAFSVVYSVAPGSGKIG